MGLGSVGAEPAGAEWVTSWGLLWGRGFEGLNSKCKGRGFWVKPRLRFQQR